MRGNDYHKFARTSARDPKKDLIIVRLRGATVSISRYYHVILKRGVMNTNSATLSFESALTVPGNSHRTGPELMHDTRPHAFEPSSGSIDLMVATIIST